MRNRRFMPVALFLALPLAACAPDEDASQADPPLPEIVRFTAGDVSSMRLAEELSLKHVYEIEPNLIDGVEGIWAKRVKIDKLGEAHTRIIQTVDNIPIFGAESIIHLNADGTYRGMTDGFVRDVEVDTRPLYRELEALDIAVDSQGGWERVTGTPAVDMQVLREDGVDRLTYRVQIDQFEPEYDPAMPVVFVDAHTGEVVSSYNNLKTSRNRRTHTANYGTSLPGTLVRQENSGPSNDWVVNQAHDHAGITYDYYFSRFGRDSYDGNGATIRTTVHYGNNYVNAFWNGSQMVYGDGDGVVSGPLTVLDVVAHELTHAVTEYSSNLIYRNESGALNEAMSDVFAAAVEAYRDGAVTENTWKIGEACWTPGTPGDALRYMNNPTLAGDRDYYPERYVGSGDNGGVHWNSGIANLAFYLLSQGGTHPRNKTSVVVPGIGIEKAARIFYRANTVYLGPNSNFQAARTATANAAADIFGANSAERTATHLAWDAVGVPGSPGNPTDPPPGGRLQNGQTVSNLSASTGNWLHFYLPVPAGATDLRIATSGGTGDVDLYVKLGSQPTTSSYDCRPYRTGNEESCVGASPSAGNWYISLRAYSTFSGVSLAVSYTEDGGGGGYPGLELDQPNVSGSSNTWRDWSINVPGDATTFVIEISGGTGDADLYVRRGARPTATAYDCRPYLVGNNETCSINNPAGGTWYISLRGYSDYSGVRLTADYDK